MLVKCLCLFVSVEFFDGGRPHMKQELLEPEDEFSSIQTTNFIKIPTTILKAWQVDLMNVVWKSFNGAKLTIL